MTKIKVKQNVIIISGGGHARSLSEALGFLPNTHVLGYTDLKSCLNMKLTYLGNDTVLKKSPGNHLKLVNGLGSVSRPSLRQRVYERFKRDGFKFMSVIHPSAIISKDAQLAEGVQVLAMAVINLGVCLAENVIINTAAVIEHDVIIGAHTHIAPRATICGGVNIGQGVHVGAGATIIQGIKIGNGALIAAGAVVIKNVPAKIRVAGVPARKIK